MFVISSVVFVFAFKQGPPKILGFSKTSAYNRISRQSTSVLQSHWTRLTIKANMKQTVLQLIMLIGLSNFTVFSSYALLIPKVPDSKAQFYQESNGKSGSGFNPGNQGFNPGLTGGSGYNPGYSNQVGDGVIAFSATRAETCCQDYSSTVKFERSLTNLGGGWGGRSGIFTAPASGTYFFSWSALSPSNQELRLSLMMNGLEMASSWADKQGYQSCSGSVLLTLRKEDQVGLQVTEGRIFESSRSGRGYTMFSGYRVG